MSGSEPKPAVTLPDMFALFARIGLTSFGGGLSAWIYREVVDRRRWLSEDEFLAGLTLSQILPGPNVVNICIYIGQRLRGTAGSVTAVLALLLPPMVVAVLLLVVFRSYGQLAWLHDLLEGIAAAAIGLTFSVGYRAARHATESNRWAPAVLAAVFLAIGVLRWPLIPVVICLAPVAVLIARKKV
ncbi:MAG TPA: chromate transporter [Dongiaceae bacterium]|jgi:chromate transporter|nr:chromate transporter [Dongiaceae bacterium]